MLYNIIKTQFCFAKLARVFIALALAMILSSCEHGFYEPITLNVDIPDGPPEYRSGFRGGCRSGLGTRTFSNSFVYKPDYGTGIYQHDQRFIDGWRHGWFSCVIHAAIFTAYPHSQYAPMQ